MKKGRGAVNEVGKLIAAAEDKKGKW